MIQEPPSFNALAAQLGGFNQDALRSFFYVNNPLALKSWTMNVVELLMILGAIMGFLHAWQRWRQYGNPANLAVWCATLVFLLTIEIPSYFPGLLGEDPNAILFVHNEFSVGLFYDRTPLYIVALYPALMYAAYALTEGFGFFKLRYGWLLGAIATGFFHDCFYEIFDHFGPEYGWWAWNYPLFDARIASVPLTSLFGFAFIGPISLTLLARLLIAAYVNRCLASGRKPQPLAVIGLTVLTGFFTPLLLALLSPDSVYCLLTAHPDIIVLKIVSFALIALAGIITLRHLFVTCQGARPGLRYPVNFFTFYLAVFAGLWAYALPSVLVAKEGIAANGHPVGSPVYVAGCYLVCMFVLARASGVRAAHAPRTA
jgi:hypothetical protein